MAEPIVNIIDPITFTSQEILPEDRVLIQNQVIDSPFDLTKDQVELYIYDYNQNLIVADYNFLAWKSYNDPALIAENKLQDLYIDPAIDGTIGEVTNGLVYLIYNFVSNKLNSSDIQQFYIDQISSDRTEISLKSNNLTNLELETLTGNLITELQNTEYFQEFYLNFGNNNSIIGVNIRVNKNNPVYSLDIKLYEPLPSSFDIKSTCWVQTKIADAAGYSVEYSAQITLIDEKVPLRGPNYNLKINGETSTATNFENLTTLKQTNLTSSRAQIDSILNQKGITLNIDYSDYGNFVHFSTAKTRVENFYYKASLIESYQNNINAISSSTTIGARATSITTLQSGIDELIKNFDGYEYYLYYSSESKAWPKTTNTLPYILASTGSAAVLNWYGDSIEGSTYYGGQRYSASIYDNLNQDNLINTIPQFIANDSTNQPYVTFVEMVGQHFDTLYTYTQGINQKYNADNRLNYGISKDLIVDALKSFGLKVYENNFSTSDLYTALTGLTPSGSTLLLPNITQTYPVTGSGIEYIQTIISASNDNIPLDDLNKSIYKRLYHNLPLLVKKKGTVEGLKLLINSYGIPNTILRINEFGGKDKNNATYDNWQAEYNYGYNTKAVSYITSSFTLNSAWNATDNKPSAVEFRFKTFGIPNSNYSTQSLWSTDTGATLLLKYTGSGYTSGSYSGSSVNPYYEYGTLEFYPSSSNTTTTASIYLPFFDGGWWSILVNKNSATEFTVYAENKLYNGDSGNIIGFQGSSSVTLTNPWSTATKSYFATSSLNSKIFSGSIQEVRYYSQPISQSTFDAYVMNPYSIEQSEYLAFRATLGGELYTSSISIHPKVSGEQVITSSFASTSTFLITGSGAFQSNTETIFFDQVAAGTKNAVSDKIKVGTDTNYGTVLSNTITIQQNLPTSQNITPDVNYLEVGFSPQNEINEDINSQFGYFNIGEYIGDPRNFSSDNLKYPALDQLSLEYFKKYTQSYNLQDYFRLIKFFDNSLFKLIKDFVPARTGAATGVIVKQHLLERNRQRPAQVDYTQPEYSASVTSLPRDYQPGSIEVFTGGAGGSVNVLSNISQSWSSSISTKAGLVNQMNSSQYEFFNGEYSGSSINIVKNKLQDNPLLGPTYRVSIPDLQNLNISSNIAVSGSGGDLSLPIPFNIQNKVIAYYNTSSYTYQPKYSVQSDIVVYVTASITGTGGGALQTLYLAVREDTNLLGYVAITTVPGGAFSGQINKTLTIPDVYIKAGSSYTANLEESGAGGFTPLTASFNSATTWTITVDNLAAQSTYYLDPTVYTQQNFPGDISKFPDYNALLNNVYSNRVSSKYYDVDYSTNLLTPVNLSGIISQSALYAQVQDSNYSKDTVWVNSRYDGVKNTGLLNTSINFSAESQAPGYPVDKFSNYFARFSYNASSDPEYPGGGLFKLVELINVDGTRIPLTGDNKYVSFISEVFKAGKTVTAYGRDVSVVKTVTDLQIIEGGAYYQSILYKTGSVTAGFAYSLEVQNPTQVNTGFDTALSSSSPWTFVDDNTQGTLFALLTGSSTTQGKINNIATDYDSSKIFNRQTGTYAPTSTFISYGDTYLPLQYGDFIRFGSGSVPMDSTSTGRSLNQYLSASIGNELQIGTVTSFIYFGNAITSPLRNTLDVIGETEYRIFRRIPDETWIVTVSNPNINTDPATGGLLIPNDFNPAYDPITVARQAGIEL